MSAPKAVNGRLSLLVVIGVIGSLTVTNGDDSRHRGSDGYQIQMAVDEDGERRLVSFALDGAQELRSAGVETHGKPANIRSFECRAERLHGEERNTFLKAHNDARAQVGSEPVTWSDALASYSLEWQYENRQSYLDAILGTDITDRPSMPPAKHRPNDGPFARKYGENWSRSFGPPTSKELISPRHVSAWLSEKEAFERLNNEKPYVVGDEEGKTDSQGKAIIVGHYTQIIWKTTTKVGASKWICRTKDGDRTKNELQFEVVFANYEPSGNMRGQSPLNQSTIHPKQSDDR